MAGVLLAGSSAHAAGTLSFVATVKNRSDSQVAPQLTWSNITVGHATWSVSDQYIQLDSVMTDPTNGFIRTYTDNMGSGANPAYTGANDANNNPAGLINTSAPSQKIPLAWSIRDQLGQGALPAGDPNTTFVWFYFFDKSQVGFMSTNNPNNIDYQTVQASGPSIAPGPWLHFAPGVPWSAGFPVIQGSWGQASSPNYMYLEADFSFAMAATYQSNMITIEAFNL